jgi:CsoR family transcriptional regulator, copper-sensing transcriptional repressor
MSGTRKKAAPAAARAGHADPDARAGNVRRLKRIEGQVRGLQRMVEEDRYCPDIIAQVAAVQEALRGVGRQLLRHHLSHCATDAIRRGPEHAARTYDELLDLMYRHLR